MFHIFLQNVCSPAVLFFLLGLAAGALKSDPEIPDSISRYFSIYLMMSIGFKGGVALSEQSMTDGRMWAVMAAGPAVSLLLPFVAYRLFRRATGMSAATSAAVGAQYGSVSMVTFAAAAGFLKSNGTPYAGYVAAALALMEAPAILSGLYIAHRAAPETRSHDAEERKLYREVFTNGAVLLLFGAFTIGALTGESGSEKMAPFLVGPFQGILAFFLLDMGFKVTGGPALKNGGGLRRLRPSVILFGLYMPLIGAAIGLALSALIGLDPGSATLFTVLCAGASYIAVPAAMRLALPEADPSVYMPLALAVTFPFNITVGIPLYFTLAKHLLT